MTAPGRPIHLRPQAPLAERVLLPGDPHRALALAQLLLTEPAMFNHHRGLWGYTGAAADGEPLTIQSTGMGGPSAAIVVEELIGLGAGRLVRVGTCGALKPELALGTVLAAREVLTADGTSAALGTNGSLRPDPELTDRLLAAGELVPARVVSSDLFYAPAPERDADVVEMEAAALLAVCERRGARGACALVVSDQLTTGERVRIGDEALEGAVATMGRAAAAALGAG